MADDHTEPRIDAWNRRLDWPLTALAVVFGVYAWDVLGTSVDDSSRQAFDIMLWAIWALFALDYFARIYLARRKWWFVGTDFPDLLILVLPMFRQLRAAAAHGHLDPRPAAAGRLPRPGRHLARQLNAVVITSDPDDLAAMDPTLQLVRI